MKRRWLICFAVAALLPLVADTVSLAAEQLRQDQEIPPRIEHAIRIAAVDATRRSVWPWEEKLGARPIGPWRVIYSVASNRTTENAAYDEVITMTRYASRAHRDAMQPDVAAFMGGNGPDYEAWRSVLRTQQELTLSTKVELAQGQMYYSPPKFLPGLAERYRATQ